MYLIPGNQEVSKIFECISWTYTKLLSLQSSMSLGNEVKFDTHIV
jgi:hypothetical protein